MDTDSTKLISPKVEWRQREIHFDSLFPQQVNLILIVVDGETPELAEAATRGPDRQAGGRDQAVLGGAAPGRRRLLQPQRAAVSSPSPRSRRTPRR
ncbi:MAG: hypothetical protein WDN08_18215 [Rhizomicrobium sp.]